MSEKYVIKAMGPQPVVPDISVGEFLYQKLKSLNQDLVSLIDAKSGIKLTIRELLSQANSLAIALINRGITKSDRICIFGSNSIPYSVLSFAAYFLGVTVVPLSPFFNVSDLKKEIQNTESTIIFTSWKNAPNFDVILKDKNENNVNEKIKLCVVFDGNYNNYLEFDHLVKEGKNQTLDRIPYFRVNPKEDYFALIYTSGSTGYPKCVIVSHDIPVSAMIDAYNGKHFPNTVVSYQYPFGHLSGTQMLPVYAGLGATTVLYEEFDFELILQSIEKYKINVLVMFPSFANVLLDEELVDKYDLSSLKFIVTGGTPFPRNVAKAIIAKYHIVIKEVYGITEFGLVSQFPDVSPIEFISGNLGHVSLDTQLKVIDLNTGENLGPGIDGEICLKGSKIFLGYMGNESEAKAVVDSNGWLHTGDIGHYDEKERIFIFGSINNAIKVGHLTVSPIEIEQLLSNHSSIADVAVVGIKHRVDDHWLRAYVRVKEGQNVTKEEIQKIVSDSMPISKQLRAGVVFVGQTPRTNIGQIDRHYFKDLVKYGIINR